MAPENSNKSCPWCGAPRVAEPSCPKCGANYAKPADVAALQRLL